LATTPGPSAGGNTWSGCTTRERLAAALTAATSIACSSCLTFPGQSATSSALSVPGESSSSQLGQGQRNIVVGLHILGIGGQGLFILRNRFCASSLLEQSPPQCVVQIRVLRFELQTPSKGPLGPDVIAGPLVGHPCPQKRVCIQEVFADLCDCVRTVPQGAVGSTQAHSNPAPRRGNPDTEALVQALWRVFRVV
jgi:hypothetical protein